MEAPEKIHVQPNAHDGWFEGKIPNGLPNGLFVEYTRTDAFIEKAVVWISNNCYIPHSTLDNFKTYMKGE